MDFHRVAEGHDVTAREFERILDGAFPDQRVSELSALDGDGPNAVFAVTSENERRFVLKCATDRAGRTALQKEFEVMNYVRKETEVPVLETVSFDFDGSNRSPAYVVTTWAEGRTLDDALRALPQHAHPQLFSNVGETLAVLHEQTSFDDVGIIVPGDESSFEVEPVASWPELFARRLTDHVEALAGTRFEDVAEDVWSHVSGRLQTLETDDKPVLLHGDVGEGNVTYDGTSVARVLDWERAFVGHPEYDLCRAEARYFLNDWGRPSRLQAMFYSGYRSVRDTSSGFDDRRRCYLATFFLMPLATFPNWGPALAEDPDEFAERLAEKVRGVLR